MRKYSLLVFVLPALLFFSSCEAIKDALEQEADVTLNVDIPLSSSAMASAVGTKSATMALPFDGTATLNLEDEEDVKDFVDGIRNFVLNNPGLALSGLSENDTVYDLLFTATTSGKTFTFLEDSELTKSDFYSGSTLIYLLITTTEFQKYWTDKGFGEVALSISGT